MDPDCEHCRPYGVTRILTFYFIFLLFYIFNNLLYRPYLLRIHFYHCCHQFNVIFNHLIVSDSLLYSFLLYIYNASPSSDSEHHGGGFYILIKYNDINYYY